MADHSWLYHPIPRGTQQLPSCSICNDPVLLETSNTDEYGQAVHEECYVLKVCLKAEFLNDGGSMPGPANRHAIYQPCEATMAESWESPMPRKPAMRATMLMQRAKRIPWFNRRWNMDMAAVVAVLVVTCWIAFSDRHPASFLGSIALEEEVPLPPARAVPAKGRFKLQNVPVPVEVEEARSATLLQREGIAENEVVHIGEDVTVRHFTPKPAPHRVPVGQYQVVHIGEDVTVRFFTPIGRHTRN